MADSNLWLPLVVTLLAVATTLLVFWGWSKAGAKSQRKRGTKFVKDDDGANVRRSTRSRKSVTRWSPDDIGSPTGYSRQAESPGPVQKAVDAVANGISAATPKAKSSLAPKDTPKRVSVRSKTPAKDDEPVVTSPKGARSARKTTLKK